MAHRARIAIAAGLLAAIATANNAGAAGPMDAEARALFARVIAMDTSRNGRRVKELAEVLAGEFRNAGIPAADVAILPLADTASLVVRYRGSNRGGKTARKPILLLAHMDVVVARREDWQRDPFQLVEDDGYFYGRGTADNKDGLVTIVTTIQRLKREKFVPDRDLIVYFSGDEETAQFTTLDTVRNHRELIDAEFAINTDVGPGKLDDLTGRPVQLGLQTAEKTYADYALTTRNPGGHSSRPRPDNAIYDLATALTRIQAYRFPVMSNDATIATLKQAGATAPDPLGAWLRRFAANPLDQQAADALYAEPDYVGQTRTTCVATLLNGGHAENALPQSASANINCRIFPGMSLETVQKTLSQLAGPQVEIKLQGEPFWSDASPLRDDVVAAVSRSLRPLDPDVRIVPSQDAGATDGAIFRSAGIPTYGVSGMFMKNGEWRAHGLNERVPVKGFYDGLEIWYRLVKTLAAPASAAAKSR
jgi:acetylornithine deacetylase/succinyl-diaminopimelate desuccinylase-like protein